MSRPLLRMILPMAATFSLLFPQICGAYMSPDEVFGVDGSQAIPAAAIEQTTEPSTDIAPVETPTKPAAQTYSHTSIEKKSQESSLLRIGGALLSIVILLCATACLIVRRYRRHSSAPL